MDHLSDEQRKRSNEVFHKLLDIINYEEVRVVNTALPQLLVQYLWKNCSGEETALFLANLGITIDWMNNLALKLTNPLLRELVEDGTLDTD